MPPKSEVDPRLSTAAINRAVIKTNGEFIQRSDAESETDRALRAMFMRDGFSTGPQWAYHANAYLKRQALSRLLYLDQIYSEIVEVPGVICEFGVQYGATTATLVNLRGIHEPYNHSRHIYGFDTFEGFPTVDAKDGNHSETGDYAVPQRYEERLEALLALHEANAPLSHIRRFHLIKGDASTTVPAWIAANPHVVIALAVLDMDIYKPTVDVLNAIRPRLVKGSIVVFDEMNCPHFPGETLAALEVFGLNSIALRRHPHQPYCSWFRVGD
jgi:hypothetical protein